MSKLIDKYQTLRNTIIERAIHINNMLYDLYETVIYKNLNILMLMGILMPILYISYDIFDWLGNNYYKA